jgi:hypothetical protein
MIKALFGVFSRAAGGGERGWVRAQRHQARILGFAPPGTAGRGADEAGAAGR